MSATAPTSATVLARVAIKEIAARMRAHAPSLRGVGPTASDAGYNRMLRDADTLDALALKIEVPHMPAHDQELITLISGSAPRTFDEPLIYIDVAGKRRTRN